MPRGGRRPGAGRKPGTQERRTVEKEALRDLVRKMVAKDLGPLVAAQIANAKGIKYLVVRDIKTGKFLRVGRAMAAAKAKLKAHEEIIEIWEKDPSVQAFTDLLNRALDRPAEQKLEVEVSSDEELLTLLRAARQRVMS